MTPKRNKRCKHCRAVSNAEAASDISSIVGRSELEVDSGIINDHHSVAGSRSKPIHEEELQFDIMTTQTKVRDRRQAKLNNKGLQIIDNASRSDSASEEEKEPPKLVEDQQAKVFDLGNQIHEKGLVFFKN